mmetsp:Transcript_39090/g.82209  ORF Transcript_39090/g.82209 Transcript_39090/m.82209 type:complete len:81 (+) Transcript_39090:522-764(+)
MSAEKTIFLNDCCALACKTDSSAAAFGPDSKVVVLVERAMIAPLDHPLNGINTSEEATNDITESLLESNLHSDEAESYKT